MLRDFRLIITPIGFLFDVSGSCAFPKTSAENPILLGSLNSELIYYLLSILNPTIHFQVGDLARLPVPIKVSETIEKLVRKAVRLAKYSSLVCETTFDFIAPPSWSTKLQNLAAIQTYLVTLETQIDDEIYRLYGISKEDRVTIEAELAGGALIEVEESDEAKKTGDEEDTSQTKSSEELAVCWISYTVGVVLGRFQPGLLGDWVVPSIGWRTSLSAHYPHPMKPSSTSWLVIQNASPISTRAAGGMSSPQKSRLSCVLWPTQMGLPCWTKVIPTTCLSKSWLRWS